jgi:hypothetical protein
MVLKFSSQASISEALREPNAKARDVCFSSDAPPADGWGLRIGIYSRKFCGSSAKERAKVKMPLKKVAQKAFQRDT